MVIPLVVLVIVPFVVWWALHAWWWDVKFRGRLPPGSMGWPLLGESLDLVCRLGYSNEPMPFFKQRQARHGSLFKSHLFGNPTIVSTSATINTFVLKNEGVLFKLAYPTSFERVLGKLSLMENVQVHAQFRKKIMRIMGPAALPHYVSDIEESVLDFLSTWEHMSIVLLHKEACKMSFDLVVKRLIGLTSKDAQVKVMMKNLSNFSAALISLPINLPGTSFNLGLKARKEMIRLLESVIHQRIHERHLQNYHSDSPKDLLDALLDKEEEDNETFTRNWTLDVMVAVLYGAYEATATSLTFCVMLLGKHQEVLDKLLVEHMAIKRKKGPNNRGLTWEDYTSMSYTKDVIYETLRIANIAPFVYRQALRDVQVGGYIIPKGWKVIPSLSSSHVDSTNYKEPLDFNPSRWKDDSNPKVSFMPFGGGSRVCAGNDLGLLEISIFLHHFLTNYKWSEVRKDQVIRIPAVRFKYGYPIKIIKKDELLNK